MKIIRLVRIFIFLSVLIYSLNSVKLFAGVGTSGGGQFVFDQSGNIRFLDFITDQNQIMKNPTEEMVQKIILGNKPIILQLGAYQKNFFACAIKKLKSTINLGDVRIPIIDNLIEKIHLLPVIMVEFPLLSVEKEKLENSDLHWILKVLPLITEKSSTYNGYFQLPVAAYNTNRLYVYNRAFISINEEEQCGVQVHEFFRYLNFSGDIIEPLTTEEIEAMTRLVFNKNTKEDEELFKSAKRKLEVSFMTMEETRKLADEYLLKAKSIDRELDENYRSMTKEEYERKNKLFKIYLRTSATLTTTAVSHAINNLMPEEPFQNLIDILGRTAIEKFITTPLETSIDLRSFL